MAGLPPLLLLKSPLGDDREPYQVGPLHAIEMVAREEISAPFLLNIHAVSTQRSVDPDELLYKPVSVTVRRKDATDRLFNGIVRRLDAIGVQQRDRWEYKLEVVPFLWFLDQTVDCRIFQQQTPKQILEEIFAEKNVRPVEFRIFGNTPVRPYTTQFDETDLQFVQRIMQESGYYYFFEHSETQHKLVITDGNQAFRPQVEPLHRVIYQGNNSDIINSWNEGLSTATGSVEIQDYDPEKPKKLVTGQDNTRLKTSGASNRTTYRWPAMTIDNQVAEDRARFRQEAAEARASLSEGHGFDPHMCAGFRFTVAEDPIGGGENEFVIHEVTHHAKDRTWLGGTEPPEFDCSFTCFRKEVTWRDDLSIPRPVMTGIFSGIVLGEGGEEIHADRLARIKVRPLFDHRQDTTAAKSIFIRILHAWSGDKWGWQHLPRVGTEVGISFMSGDPDYPVVVGCFYHDDNMPVFDVPSEQTKQGFRSRSTLNGTNQEYNELSFDDKRYQEKVFLQAQKDHEVNVKHNQDSKIGNNRTVTTQVDDTLTSVAGSILIQAPIKITIQCGASQIIMTPADITINTPSFVLNAGAIQVDTGAVNIDAGVVNITSGDFTIESPDIALATPLLEAPIQIPIDA